MSGGEEKGSRPPEANSLPNGPTACKTLRTCFRSFCAREVGPAGSANLTGAEVAPRAGEERAKVPQERAKAPQERGSVRVRPHAGPKMGLR